MGCLKAHSYGPLILPKRFQDIAEYWSNFRCRQWHTFGITPKYRIVEFSTTEKKHRCMVQYKARSIGLSNCVHFNHECDGQTDGQTFSLNDVAQPKVQPYQFSRIHAESENWTLRVDILLISIRQYLSNVLVSRLRESDVMWWFGIWTLDLAYHSDHYTRININQNQHTPMRCRKEI